jgi:hypothetical protein
MFIYFRSYLVFHFGVYIMSNEHLSSASVSLASRLFCLYLGRIYHSCYYVVGSGCCDSKAEYLIYFVEFSEIVAFEGVQQEHCSKKMGERSKSQRGGYLPLLEEDQT